MTIRYSVFRRWTLLRVLIAGVALVASTVVGASDSPPRGIAVAGRGEAKGKPGIVELSGTVTGEAELASDAITKYRDNRQRAIEALENLKIDGLKVTGSGVSINSALSAQAMQQMMNGMGTSGSGNARLQSPSHSRSRCRAWTGCRRRTCWGCWCGLSMRAKTRESRLARPLNTTLTCTTAGRPADVARQVPHG